VPHWADGDVIVGDTLLDVKTVITLRDRDRIARWLYQLLGYVWLDSTADLYGIRNVGLYLAATVCSSHGHWTTSSKPS
jgi:hypothetical protein